MQPFVELTSTLYLALGSFRADRSPLVAESLHESFFVQAQ